MIKCNGKLSLTPETYYLCWGYMVLLCQFNGFAFIERLGTLG
jgi:hypothetical protein